MQTVIASCQAGTVAKLLDFLLAEHDLKNDAELAREMSRDPAYVSKLRHNKLPLSSNLILFIHEHFGIGVQEIRDRSGQQAGQRA
jgi:plasmid maintenance system antidote protein VapI